MKKNKLFFKTKYNAMLISGILSFTFICFAEMVDSIIAGIFLGETAVSAIGIVAPFYTIIIFVATMFSQGVGVIYTQRLGAFKKNEAYKVCGMGVIINVISGLILALIMLIGRDYFLGLFNLSSNILIDSQAYYNWYVLVAITYPIYCVIYNLVMCDGDPVLITTSDIINTIANIVISVLLVNTMGIAGLGLGTAASNIISLLVLSTHFIKKSNTIRIKASFNAKVLGKVVKIGLPLTCTYLYTAVVDMVMNKFVISNFGDMYLPAYAICNLVLNTCTIMAAAVSAAGPQLCVYYGENNDKGIKKIMKTTTNVSIVLGAIYTVSLIVFSKYIPSIYGIVTPQVFNASVRTVIILAITMIPTAICNNYLNYYSYVDKETISTIGGGIYSFIVPVLLGPLFGSFMGYDGISVGIALAPLFAWLYYYLVVRIKYGKENVMLCLPKPDGKLISYDIKVCDKDIMELRDKIGQDLIEEDVELSLIKKVELMVEETYMLIKEKNLKVNGKTKRNLLSECNVIINDKEIKLITRDNGVLFDITDENAEIKSLRCYIVANFMEKVDDKSYLLTSSFNRNSYVFERTQNTKK